MKKLIAVVLLLSLPLALFSKRSLCDFADSFPSSTVTVYADGFEDGGINNCGLYFLTCSVEKAKKLYRSARNVRGITLSFSGSIEELDSYLALLSAREVYREKISGKIIVYAYSPRINVFVSVNNKKVNLQICFESASVLIGSPLLLGSY